jgi:hypothetical protein
MVSTREKLLGGADDIANIAVLSNLGKKTKKKGDIIMSVNHS